MAKSVLVLGGTGQIGYASAQVLQAAGWQVTVAHRGHRAPPPDLDVETVVVDREDTAALSAAARGHDLVLDTVAFTRPHAEQLLGLDIGALIVISTISVYRGANHSFLDVSDERGFPDFPVPIDEDCPTIEEAGTTYSPQKAALERTLLNGEVPVSILRAGAIHGPYSPSLREWFFIKRVLDGRRHVVLAWDGTSRFQPASTANLAALVLACAERPGTRVLNAVDDECPTETEIGQAVFAAMGHEADILTISGPPRGTLGSSPWGLPVPVVASMDRARAEVGYRSVLPYAEAVRLDVAWARQVVADLPVGATPPLFAGSENCFDYAAEDAYVVSLTGD